MPKMAVSVPSVKAVYNKIFLNRIQVFYVIAALLVIICVAQLYEILKIKKLKYGNKQILKKSFPNLEIYPIVNASLKTVFIKYDENDFMTIDKWIYLIDNFLEDYGPENVGPYAKVASTCDFKHPPLKGQVCPLDLEKFGPCSPPDYGFYSTSPCVILKLPRINKWIPECYNDTRSLPTEMPKDLIQQIQSAISTNESNQVWVSCKGIHDADKEHIKTFNYYPSRGFPSYYYPATYRTGKGFSPLVAVEIVNPKPGLFINIECRVWAKNIEYRDGTPQERSGSVEFTIMRDELVEQDSRNEELEGISE